MEMFVEVLNLSAGQRTVPWAKTVSKSKPITASGGRKKALGTESPLLQRWNIKPCASTPPESAVLPAGCCTESPQDTQSPGRSFAIDPLLGAGVQMEKL